MTLPFSEDLSTVIEHVQAPSEVVFICGGEHKPGDQQTLSLRDAFLKILERPLPKGVIPILAEDITSDAFFFSLYGDILLFEIHLAQITNLILLFCEGYGGMAELGAFAATEQISAKVLAVIPEKFNEQDSFIKLGPLRRLRNTVGASSVCVLDDAQLCISANLTTGKIDVSSINKEALKRMLADPIRIRISENKPPSSFDRNNEGHRIKLMVGLIQEYGALKFEEIKDLFGKFSITVNDNTVKQFLMCAEAVDWIREKTLGTNTYYVARNLPQKAANLLFKEDVGGKNADRRLALIREEWRKVEPERLSAISSVLSGR